MKNTHTHTHTRKKKNGGMNGRTIKKRFTHECTQMFNEVIRRILVKYFDFLRIRLFSSPSTMYGELW